MNNPEDLRELEGDLRARYSLLREISFFPEEERESRKLPPFFGLLLAALDSAENGAVCIVLPRRERIAFGTAVLTALTVLRNEAGELGQRLLDREFKEGQLVRLAPEGYTFEFSGHFPHENNRFFKLKVPGEETYYSLEVKKAFRLTVTDKAGRKPPKRWGKISERAEARATALDELVGIETGGNTAVLPNRVLLLSSRGKTAKLAESTLVGVGRESTELFPARVSEILTWGRVTDDGGIESEDRRDAGHPPVIATTHMVEHLAAAIRRDTEGTRRVIVDGADRARNLQALDEVYARHRTLILADYTELEQVEDLRERGVPVWAPKPSLVEDLSPSSHSLFARFIKGARHASDLDVDSVTVESPPLEHLAERVSEIESALWEAWADQRARRLMGKYYSLLVRAAEWSVLPSQRIRENYEKRISNIRDELDGLGIWIPGEITQDMLECLDSFMSIMDAPDLGEKKTEALLDLLEGSDKIIKGSSATITGQAVLVRTPEYARHLREALQKTGLQVPVYSETVPEGRLFDRIILSTWLSRRKVQRLLDRFIAPAFRLLAYSFEEEWFRGLLDARSDRLAKFRPSLDQLEEEIGFSLGRRVHEDASSGETSEKSIALDPISRIEQEHSTRRKGGPPSSTSQEDAREARYVDFHGPYYAYLTESHSVPVVTELVVGGELERVPLGRIRDLREGDYVLFREQGDHDVISLIARQQMGEEQYDALLKTAHLWRPALRSIGFDPPAIHESLQVTGLTRALATVRGWLRDDSRIGPESREDLEIIAEVSGDEQLGERLSEVCEAIGDVRGAHIKAGHKLSELLIRELPEVAESVEQEGSRVDLTFGAGRVVCVRMINAEIEERPYWEVNSLRREESL